MYITGEETALFKNLSGSVEGLIFKNSLVYGGSVTSGLVTKAENSIIKDIIFDGYVISDSDEKIQLQVCLLLMIFMYLK